MDVIPLDIDGQIFNSQFFPHIFNTSQIRDFGDLIRYKNIVTAKVPVKNFKCNLNKCRLIQEPGVRTRNQNRTQKRNGTRNRTRNRTQY